MSAPWGRIDADGTVYVRTSDSEREIGSWQAGDAQSGLAFYTRRYEDLETEVTLLEKRLAAGTGDPAGTRAKATSLAEALPSAAAIGDLDALGTRLQALLGTAQALTEQAKAARDLERAEAVQQKETLIAEAETIATQATNWKASGERLRTIVDDWRALRTVDRKTDDALWKRFAAARDAFGRRRGQHFAQLDAERDTTRQAKAQLVEQARELSTSSDWRETATAMRELMTQWKAAGRVGRDAEDTLWTQFRAAQDEFFRRRSEVFSERDAEQNANQLRKEEIIAKAAGLDVADPNAAQAALRDLQGDFDQVGHVPRDSIRRLDDSMRAAEQRVRDAVDGQWRRSSAQTNPFLQAMRDRLAEAEQKLERARRSGDAARISRAEDDVAQRRALLPD